MFKYYFVKLYVLFCKFLSRDAESVVFIRID